MSGTTFSYAQAAKGQAANQPSTKDDVSSATAVPSATPIDAEVTETSEAGKTTQSPAEQLKQNAESLSVIAPATEESNKTTRENEAAPAQPQQQSEDKISRSVSRTSRSNESTDGRKGRKGKKARGSEKEPQTEQQAEEEKEKVKEAPKVILSEAPLPTVNIWAQRQEAQAAKLKTSPAPTSDAVSAEAKNQDSESQSTSVNGANGDKPHRKATDLSRAADQQQRRNGPRGARVDKEEKNAVALPPVADAASWPDPKSAASASTEAPKEKVQEKTTEKEPQEDSGSSKKKTWVAVDIQPTVVFNTPLPPRGSKTRGGARGGREQGSTRPHNTNATNASNVTSQNERAPTTGGPNGHKRAGSRPRETNMPTRANTQAHISKRTSVDAASSKDARKLSVSANNEQARDSGAETSINATKKGSSVKEGHNEAGTTSEAGPSLSSRSHERHHKGTDSTKDGAHHGVNGQQYSGREGRPERGRGGYRGRGGHNGTSGSHQSGYTGNGQYGHSSYQSRQHNSPPQHAGQFSGSYNQSTRGRGKWTGSNQNAGRNGSAPAFAPRMAQPHEYSAPQYPVPYVYYPAYDPMVPVIKAQVEYYLSLENLCKDTFLRRHMDGSGWVFLDVIASFRRMRELSKDRETIRFACSLSDKIEFVIGEDGQERLRSKESWSKFVLREEDRLEHLRHNGPTNYAPYQSPFHQMTPYGAPVIPQNYPVAATYAGYPEDQMFQAGYVNPPHYDPASNGSAVNGYQQLSAGVPDYAPPVAALTLESLTNLSDNAVEQMVVVLAYDDREGQSSSQATAVAGYESNDSGHEQTNGVNGAAVENGANVVVWLDRYSPDSANVRMDRQPYTAIRQAALNQRQKATAGETPKEMLTLYEFWSKLLLKNFNDKVYSEFRTLALEDASKEAPNKQGLKCLLDYYNNALLNNDIAKLWPQDRAAPELLQHHFQDALRADRAGSA
ncbi:uncharacterized protein B0T23DRAFT_183284 [Neurospora hispaniola]|uniref:HTH La-type RNA-binding domain-containing protein n=1 Tax=Neurospora hispaniola TaxID=588809 RepID=A0AAJ0MP86_9PEZI|nr:hypothetical protein B0T23DRAFT_183284 [Neurospora hispaniola]